MVLHGFRILVTPSYGWFNPHEANTTQAGPLGTANQLCADGHVLQFRYGKTINTFRADSQKELSYAYAKYAGGPASYSDGYYYASLD